MSPEDRVERDILRAFIAQHEKGTEQAPDNKCAKELDIRHVVAGVLGRDDPQAARIWFARLVGDGADLKGRPLRRCSNSKQREGDHRFHARAYFAEGTAHPTPAWDRVRQLDGATDREMTTDRERVGEGVALQIFISHSSEDHVLAGKLADLLRAAFRLPASSIRCTSVDGYRMSGGATTDGDLRREVRECTAFVGLISHRSISSMYVLFELGARWGVDRPLIPALAPGAPIALLSGPLSQRNALKLDRQGEVHQLVSDIGKLLDSKPEPPESYQRLLELVVNHPPVQVPESGVADTHRAKPRFTPDERNLVADLPNDAQRLLALAATDKHGFVMMTETMGGMSLSVNETEFVERGNARSEAVGRRTVQTLVERGLLEPQGYDGEIFKVSAKGYEAADLLERLDK